MQNSVQRKFNRNEPHSIKCIQQFFRLVACALSLLPISLRPITSSFSQNYLQTLDHVILPQFFLFALFIPSSVI